jgi:hypothetical protein
MFPQLGLTLFLLAGFSLARLSEIAVNSQANHPVLPYFTLRSNIQECNPNITQGLTVPECLIIYIQVICLYYSPYNKSV